MAGRPVPTIVTTQVDTPAEQHPDNTTSPTLLGAQSPPSPTHSANSVHFNNSTALRDNNPNAHSGADSLNLLNPNKQSNSPSNDGTEADPNALTPTVTGTTKAGGESPNEKIAHIDPSTDTTDPAPYGHAPLKLASLVDPKNLDLLTEMGGIDGIITGLGTHATRGLSTSALASQPGAHAEKGADPTSASMEDRQRVYGVNTLPARKSKSLLQLMWLALSDKVLVSEICLCTVRVTLPHVFRSLDSIVCCGCGLSRPWTLL